MRTVSYDVDSPSSGANRFADVKDRVGSALGAARGRLARADADMRSAARHAAYSTDDYVHRRPWTAMGLGLLAGLLIGALLSRRY